MGLHRPTRIAGAVLIIVLTYLVLRHVSQSSQWSGFVDTTDLPDSKDNAPGVPGGVQDNPLDALPGTPDPAAPLPQGIAGAPLVEDTSQGKAFPPNTDIPAPVTPPQGLAQAVGGAAGAIAEDIHKRSTADEFLPHFKAVTQIPGMTMAEAKSGCNWPDMNKVNFQYNGDEWIAKDRSDEELESRRKQWHDFMDQGLLPYSQYKDRFEGRGIIIVAGNQKSMKRVRVILRQLKKLGSKLPIEIHYWDDEMTPESKKDISSLWPKMYFNDLSAPTNVIKTNHDGFYINYQLKTAAVINSRFAEPLLLDSDNIPVIDPEELYESDVYKEYGTLFWPDIARTRPNNPIWGITNTKCRMDEYEQESGQMIVDKRKFFYHLQLAAWLNNQQAAYYNTFLLGDKDMFRFTWHALKTKYGAPPKWITSVGTLTDGFYCGHSFAQHHPDGRVAFMHGGLVKTITKEEMKWQRESKGGIFQAYKRSKYDEQHSVNEHVMIKWNGANYLPNKPKDLAVSSCTDYFDVPPKPLDDIVPGFEKTYEEIGGYWLLDG